MKAGKAYLTFIIIFLIMLTLIPVVGWEEHTPEEAPGLVVVAGDDEDEDEGEDDEDENELAESLGELAWNAGPPLILAFMAYKYALPWMRRYGIRPPMRYRTVLDLHILSGLLLALAALAHGLMYLDRATLLEYAMGTIIIIIIVTGALLRYAKSAQVKRYARLIHAQRLLALTLFILVLVHTTLND